MIDRLPDSGEKWTFVGMIDNINRQFYLDSNKFTEQQMEYIKMVHEVD